MNRSYSIAAIIFDMDGLMLDTERSARLGWETAFHEHGYHLTEEVYIQMLGRTPEDIKNLFLSSFGPDFPYESIRKRRMEITREFHQIHGYPTKEGLFSLIQFFRKLKLPLAVATSTSRKSALPRMQAAGLSS
ncbi:MAG: HAD family phosphatase, partial [Methanobacteriota archaeon]